MESIKKIVGFGDSWMWADELLDPALVDHPHAHPVLVENTPYRESHSFLGRLGQHYDVPTENFGIAGGSLQSTLWTFLWWLQHETLDPKQCLVLVALTDPNRQTFYNPHHVSYSNDPPWNRFVHSAWVHCGNTANGREWVDFVKQYTVLSDCESLHRLNFEQTTRFFQGQHSLGIRTLQFNSIESVFDTEIENFLWPRSALNDALRDLRDPAVFAPNGHPSELGHDVIHKLLIPEIDRVILA